MQGTGDNRKTVFMGREKIRAALRITKYHKKVTGQRIMGRKKKTVQKAEKIETEKPGFTFETILHSDAKRSIAAVILFALALLFLLAYFTAAGIVGEWINTGLGMLLGFGKWLFPFVLVSAGVMFLKRRTTTLADVVRFVGLTLGFFAILGLLHLYSGKNPVALLQLARDGQGGGFVGFGFAYVIGGLTGKVAGTVILLALFATGMIAAFNVSLMRFFEQMQQRVRVRRTPEGPVPDEKGAQTESDPPRAIEESTRIPDVVAPLGSDTETLLVKLEEDPLTLNNIRNLQFPDETTQPVASESAPATATKPALAVDSGRTGWKQERKQHPPVRWILPPPDLIESSSGRGMSGDTERVKHIIKSTLQYFGIEVEPGDARVGPTVTQYTFRPASGVKLSRITTLSKDLALALAAQSIRIEAPIPGQSLIGIELPNKSVAQVRLRTFLESREFQERPSDLMLALGEDVAGRHILADLRKMPHLLIAGRTGSGKSVSINSFLLSLLYQNSPEDLKLILVDPKRVELSAFKGIPHLSTDVIMENKKVVNVLRWAVGEMERRYRILEEAHVRDLSEYRRRCTGERQPDLDPQPGKGDDKKLAPLPYIVIVIDEMADLMVSHGKEVESVVIRLAQMSRAVGIHLILATQRPSVEILTGTIKANIPTRIAFQVTTQIDSRTILDAGGAEKLLGNGDMLYSPSEGTEIQRLQGVYVSDQEVRRVTDFWRKQKEELGEVVSGDTLEGLDAGQSSIIEALDAIDEGSKEDDMYEEAKRFITETGKASTTSLQTAFSIGYPRAARLMHLLEENGVVGVVDGKKKVLLSRVENSQPGGDFTEMESEKQYGDDPLQDQAARDKWQL